MEKKKQAGFSTYAYVILAMIFAACVMGQVFLAGMAIFGKTVFWSWHVVFIRYFEYVPILMIIFAFTGRLSRELRWMPFGLIILIAVQYFTANMADSSWLVAAVHPVTGMGMFVLAMNIVRKSWPTLFKAEA